MQQHDKSLHLHTQEPAEATDQVVFDQQPCRMYVFASSLQGLRPQGSRARNEGVCL